MKKKDSMCLGFCRFTHARDIVINRLCEKTVTLFASLKINLLVRIFYASFGATNQIMQ